METYSYFSVVYDEMMSDVPYEAWVAYLMRLFERFNVRPKMILDLGCGTGTVTTMLAQKGYEMIGLDLSQDMLLVARDKAVEAQVDILYLCQDMVEMELYGTVDCVLSVCDSLNYILEEAALVEVFRKVNNYLNPGGLFIFDLNTVSKFEMMGDRTFAQTYEHSAFIWENEFDSEEKLNTYQLTLFIETNGCYQRHEEVHYERAYEVERIKILLMQAGLKLEAVFGDLSETAPRQQDERIYFVARESGKSKTY